MAAAVIVARGSASGAEDPAAAAPGAPATSLPGYGTGPVFAGGSLDASNLESSIREGNALTNNNLAQLINAIKAAAPGPAVPPVVYKPLPVTPPAGNGPMIPPATKAPGARIIRYDVFTPAGLNTVFQVSSRRISSPREIRTSAPSGWQTQRVAGPGVTAYRIIGGSFAGYSFIPGRSGPITRVAAVYSDGARSAA